MEHAPAFVVRVAGLPMEILDRLRFDRTTRLADEIVEIERWLAERGAALSDPLHDVIGRTEDRERRRRLIALRRDLFQGRMPRGGRPDEDLLREVPEGPAAEIGEWCARAERLAALTAAARTELADESRRKRRELREAAGDPAFLSGLVLASRDLYSELVKWLAAEGEPREDRQLERRLVKYLSRMAAKTSPYSTFTGSAEGRWSADGDRAVRSSPEFSRVSVVEPHAFTLRQIRRALARRPPIRPHLTLEINGSLQDDGRVLRFLGSQGDEAILELAAGPAIRRVLDEVRDGPDRTYGGVVARLAGPDEEGHAEEIARFLDKLIEIGLLETGFGIPDGDPDPLGRLVAALEPFPDGEVAHMRGLLARLRADLEAYPRADDPSERFRLAGVVRRDLDEIYRGLGWNPDGEEVPKNPFYEDSLIRGADIRWSEASFEGLLEDLDLLRRLAGLYDRFLPGRLAAAAFFEDHYGTGAVRSLMDFYRDFCAETKEPPGWRPGYRISGADLLTCYEEPFPVPATGLGPLDDVARLQREIVRQVAAAPVDGEGRRRIDRERLRDFVAGLPDVVRPIESMAFYCQVADRGGRTEAVVNELTTGFGRSRARLLRLDEMCGGGAFEHSRWEEPDGRHAEIAGATGSNLNLKHPLTSCEIHYPGTVSARPRDRRIPMNDLLVVHDPTAGRLRLMSKSRGEEITPVHLGLMVEFLLPAAYRFLIQMFGQAVPRFEFVKQLATAGAHRESGDVRGHPRLCLGDVVVNRALWTVPAARVPRQEKGQSPLDHLLALRRWRERHGIPERCFVRAFAGERAGSARARLDGLLEKSRKPLYVDFSSPFFLRVLDQLVSGPDRLIVFEEMLPGPSDLVVRDGRGSYASEFVVELTGRREGDG
ncbi:lantibiotic dehydratase [Microbispora sp. NPDC046933]|uniref:lantibiotic dehydratase n=1 Tax=Microbispora sp. NPDC046933 TaxID=3155618 RepID=UPI0033F977A0